MEKLLFSLAIATLVWGNPEGPAVNSGAVQIQEMGPLLEVKASDRSVIDWHSFSIGAGETTRFILPSSDSAVLNRVTGSEISQLMGLLEANGAIYLTNPNGIVIGKEGQISAASFFGSSLQLNVDDFLSGKSIRFDGDAVGTITNLGQIRASTGSVTLLSHKIQSDGVIEAKNGAVNLLSGHEILIDPTGENLLFIQTGIEGEGIDVQGTIEALEVRMESQGPYGIAIGLGDAVDASVIVRENGKIYLTAHDGPFKMDRNSSLVAPHGEITLLGERIELMDGLIDASGNDGGGTIRIGGDYPAIDQLRPLAQTNVIGKSVTIKSDALMSGDGGDVVIWGEERTQFQGSISAQALGEAGDGGFAEISARNHLMMKGQVKLSARSGKTGTLLLDPLTVTIAPGVSSGGSFSGCVPPNTFTPSGGDDVIADSDLQTLLETCAVTINSSGSITMDSCIVTPVAQNLLTLIAATFIDSAFAVTMNTPLTMTAGSFIVLDTDFGNSHTSSTQSTTWTAQSGSIALSTGTAITTTGPVTFGLSATQSISVTGGLSAVQFTSSYAGATPFTAFDFTSTGAVSGTYSGIDINLASVTATRGSISMTGQGGDTGSSNRGISLTNCTLSTSQGNVTLTGTGGGTAGGTGNVGVYLANYLSDISITSGNVSITGTGGSGTTGNIGIQFAHAGVPVNPLNISGTGTITLNGTGGGSSTGNDGIQMASLCTITATGSGTISMTGTAAGTSRNGINLAGGDLSTVNGNMTLSGAGASGNGILVQTIGSNITSTGSGSISLTSTTGDILIGYNGTGGGVALVQGSGTGGITMTSAGSLSITGGAGGETSTVSITAGAGDITLLAGTNLTLSTSTGGIPSISNSGTGAITLVADNDFPVSGTGTGQFNLSSTGTLTTSSGELRIYTVDASQNTISAATINGLAYPTSSHEVSGVYYPSGSYVSPSYTIYYKTGGAPPPPPPPPPAPAPSPPPVVVAETTVAIVQPVAEPAQIAQQTTITNQQPTSTPDTKKGCRSPSVAIQAL